MLNICFVFRASDSIRLNNRFKKYSFSIYPLCWLLYTSMTLISNIEKEKFSMMKVHFEINSFFSTSFRYRFSLCKNWFRDQLSFSTSFRYRFFLFNNSSWYRFFLSQLHFDIDFFFFNFISISILSFSTSSQYRFFLFNNSSQNLIDLIWL